MPLDDSNLYEILFPDIDDDDEENTDDIGRLRINEMFNNIDVNEISKYFDLDMYNQSFPIDDHASLSVMHFNIRNLITNKDELTTNISLMNRPPDVIALSETWLDLSDDTVINIEGYRCYNVIRDTPHS